MRHTSRYALPLAGLMLGIAGSGTARAVPSAAQVMKDLKAPGVLSIRLRGPGRRVWSTGYKQYMWDQTAVVTRKAGIREFPKAMLEIGGIASYYIAGGRLSFNRFFVTYNSYSGIPAPSQAQILSLLQKDRAGFLGHPYLSIVGAVEPIRLAANPEWNWHTPNSVSFMMTTGYQQIISNTKLEKIKAAYEVRLYRDGVTKPWKTFHSSLRKTSTVATTTKSEDEIKKLKTLRFVDAERAVTARLASLPTVSIPAFKTDLELFAFVHRTLRENDARKTEAVLRRLMGPRYRIANSDVLLDSNGEGVIESVLKEAHGSKTNYAEQFGPDPAVEYQQNRVSFLNANGRHRTSMRSELAGGTWQNGEKVGQTHRLFEIGIGMTDDADEIARLKSMAPETRFALKAGARPFSSLGAQVAAGKEAAAHAAVVQAITWTPFTSASKRMVISFPGTPAETEGQMNDKYPMWTAEAKTDQLLCRATAIVYPKSLNRMQSQQVVQSTLQALATANGATYKTRSDMTGTVGTIGTLVRDGAVIETQVFVLGDTLYQLLMSGSPATMAAADMRAFFGSFQPLR